MRLLSIFAEGIKEAPDGDLGLAVSGGGDSMAMLELAVQYAQQQGRRVRVATVDHGLRPEAAAEVNFVAQRCTALGVDHDVLEWVREDDTGNLQDQARRARYSLIADWAKARSVRSVALAHTRDDQAETFLMRLSRSAGLDGLSGMAPVRRAQGIVWLRPLLDTSRAELRAFLEQQGLTWCEDASNSDTRYLRVRARRALALLKDLEIEAPTLAAVAAHLADARAALAQHVSEIAEEICTLDRGDIVIDKARLHMLHPETQRRLISAALCFVSSADYAPRASGLAAFQADLAAGQGGTLHGCMALVDDATIRIHREFAAVSAQKCPVQALWDSRWELRGPAGPGMYIASLSAQGLAACPNWREAGLPRSSLCSSPSVWQGTQLVSAPLAGVKNGWSAGLTGEKRSFAAFVLSH